MATQEITRPLTPLEAARACYQRTLAGDKFSSKAFAKEILDEIHSSRACIFQAGEVQSRQANSRWRCRTQ